MKFWSILTLFVFINFTALPTVAAIFDWDLPQTSMMANEEENHSPNISITEKTLPETLDVHKFIKFFKSDFSHKSFVATNESLFIPPHISIISPPPEVTLLTFNM